VVLNRDVLDIRKRTFSRNLVSQTDDYDGPVIIKTDANSGGKPENLVLRRSLWYRRGIFLAGEYLRVMRRFLSTLSLERLAYTRTLYSDSYPIYPSKEQVPHGVFENPYLVVERFLPETNGPFYYSRSYSFLGDEGVGVRLKSKNPVVKNAVAPGGLEFISVDESIVAARKALGFDYGKFDYVLHDGEAVLLDINKTPFPGTPYPPEMQQRIAAQLAKGIGAWFSTY
jgi:hypothetical protein